MDGIFGDYDGIANLICDMATKSGVSKRHIVYSDCGDGEYEAIATIDAMPNSNMAVSFMTSDNSWMVITRYNNIRHMINIIGDRDSFFDYLEKLCEELKD